MNQIAPTPTPPYYAVIFTSQQTDGDHSYGLMAEKMAELAAQQPGYLGAESVRSEAGLGITVSYWNSPEAIQNWKRNTEHLAAQKFGRDIAYWQFKVRICKVER